MALVNGVKSVSATNETQILFCTDPQVSIGVIVKKAETDTVDVDGRKILKAGTPMNCEFMQRQKEAEVADGTEKHMVGVLLHDVVVTDGDANGTLLIFGFVNWDRLDKSVQTKLQTVIAAEKEAQVTRPIYFIKD